MATADEWSCAIAEWATQDRDEGETIYLSVDERSLNEIAATKWGLDQGYDDFFEAIKAQLGVPAQAGWERAPNLKLPSGLPLNQGVPKCTAFLAFLVVCASHRGEDLPGYEGGREVFFPWVKKLLGGRPQMSREGLGEFTDLSYGAPELSLWKRWSEYLVKSDFEPVPDTKYRGTKANWGYALDQAILTVSCRKGLEKLTRSQRESLVRVLDMRNHGRDVALPMTFSTRHLNDLLMNRYGEAQVREAVLGALQGAPPGPRPARENLKLIRLKRGNYILRVEPPSRWETGALLISVNGKPLSGRELPLNLEYARLDFEFTIQMAKEQVSWERPAYFSFRGVENFLRGNPHGIPEIHEEHTLLIREECIPDLESAKRRGECSWYSASLVGGWVELDSFCQHVPKIETAGALLLVRSRNWMIFEGGFATGEPGRAIRLFTHHPGSIRSAGPEGEAEIEGSGVKFLVSPHTPTPIPNLPAGTYTLTFQGHSTNFELVEWTKVVYVSVGGERGLQWMV